MVSFGGGGGGKSKQSSKTVFPRKFLDEATEYFPDPGYSPEFQGFEDFDKLEGNLYESQKAKLSESYNDAVRRRREELSLAGLLQSPNQYLEGGARESLDRDYLTQLQAAARDSALGRMGAETKEKARRTEFNESAGFVQMQKFLALLGLAASAGRTTKGSSSQDGRYSFQMTNPFRG